MAEKTTCPLCGVKVIKKVPWQKFCSTKCANLWHSHRRQKAIALLDSVENETGEEIKLK